MPDLGYTLKFLVDHLDWLAVLDILLVTLVIFALLALVRGTQAVVLLRGIIILVDATVILKGQRILAAACIMPLTSGENITDRQMGLRHRAALGISEVSDAVAVVVSEETGAISVAHNGRMIQRLDAPRLRHILTAFYRPRGSGGGFLNGLRRFLRRLFR